MIRAAVALLLVLVGCETPSEEIVADGYPPARVIPFDEPHPLAPVAELYGVMSDGHIEPDWGCPSATGTNPDTLDAPRAAPADVLAGSLAAPVNVEGTVTGFDLCGCPDGVECGPCLPSQVRVSAAVPNRGSVVLRLFVGPGVMLCPLRVGQTVVMTVAEPGPGDLQVVGVAAGP